MSTTATLAPPARMLAALSEARGLTTDSRDSALNDLGLRPLTGGRNNHVYEWDSPDGPVCVKIYRDDDRRRDDREWQALTLLAAHDVPNVPRPLWRDRSGASPAVGMTLVQGTSIPDLSDPAAGLAGLVDTWHKIHRVPFNGPLAALDRVDSATHYIERITDIWTKQLADAAHDPLTADLKRLLDAWWDAGDAKVLEEPQARTYSRGDANLLNWLHDPGTGTTSVVDFEFSGASDPVFDIADLYEHISGRLFDEDTWYRVIAELGIGNAGSMRRFRAAQHTCALRWLAVLWKQREARAEEFSTQLERVRTLQRAAR